MNSRQILEKMTLEEKADLCSGLDSWRTKPVARLGVPSVMMSDGPHGLRTQIEHEGKIIALRAVCFPTGVALASSFDRSLLERTGRTIGKEALAANVQAVLGPAVNLKRSPLCGRNFEYLSEDQVLAGELGCAYVKGIQDVGVSVCVKHYAANSQEQCRMSINCEIDRRTLRETYMAAFEKIVKSAKPWAVMSSYNRINGVYSCENRWLLTDILRDRWGFEGITVSDWGGMNDRIKAVRAGLNIEMPSSNGQNDKRIVDAVRSGALEASDLDRVVLEILDWIQKVYKERPAGERLADRLEEDHAFAREAASQCAVLLKNEGNVLPLSREDKVVFVGGFAAAPRFQGGGSSHINCSRVVSAVEATAQWKNVSYAQGFGVDQDTDDAALLEEAVARAKEADVAVVFAGLPDALESEGYDREHLDLPRCQNALIEAIARVQPNTVVVLHNGSPVRMPWLDNVRGVLEMYLGGQAVGAAAVDLLFGDVNPSGKLAETFPLRVEDTPCYLDYPGTYADGRYSEGVFIGYRWYESRKIPVLFPFGYGLSYTRFALDGLTCSETILDEGRSLRVSVDVENTGDVYGKEVVQLYVAPAASGEVRRPAIELKGFEKVGLAPGEKKTVSFSLDRNTFAYFEPRIDDWYTPAGTYTVFVGTSSKDLPHCAAIEVKSDRKLPFGITDTTTCADIAAHMGMTPALEGLMARTSLMGGLVASDEKGAENTLGKSSERMAREMLWALPLHSLMSFSDISYDEIQTFIDSAREALRLQK